ncbi:MAG TPA: YncE family protein, partial [Terriglobia bacterium]|nr:YncE family protein [Terriglobia bacterium]
LYASGGGGTISIYQQRDRDHYTELGKMETVSGARTSLFVPELNWLCVATRREGQREASIRVYEALP